MSAESRCEEIRPLLGELALGIAEGEERARLLDHLTGCADCRARLAELSEVADGLLLLAPSEEPPAGFEGRVLGGLGGGRAWWRRSGLHVAGAVATATAVVVAGVVLFAYRDERDIAGAYRDTLEEADGRYLDAETLAGPGGEEVGTAFGYEGSPSWVLVTVDDSARLPAGYYPVEAVTSGGERLPLGTARLDGDGGSIGRAIPGSFDDVAAVRLVGPSRGQVWNAQFWRDG